MQKKKNIYLSTFNVHTLQSVKQMSELIAVPVTYHIDIMNVQEHRLYHKDSDQKYHELGNGGTSISASALKKECNSTIGREGMLLSPHAFKSPKSIERITSRILVATFHGNPEKTLISFYTPTNIADEQDPVGFYDNLSFLVRSVPKYNVLIIGGDLYAQIRQ